MASGSSGRANSSGSKAFDFASDDILCSYEDYGNQDGNNGIHSDPSSATNSTKCFRLLIHTLDLHWFVPDLGKSREKDSSLMLPKLKKKVLSPVTGRVLSKLLADMNRSLTKAEWQDPLFFLQPLIVHQKNLRLIKSIGEMRSDLLRDHGESESKLKSLEKHIQEELAKLQLAQKESSLANNNQQNEDRASTPASEVKKSENSSDTHDQQLALALPHQVSPQPSIPARPLEHQQPSMAPPSSMPPQSMPQDATRLLKPQVNQSPQVQSLPPYQLAVGQQHSYNSQINPTEPVMQPRKSGPHSDQFITFPILPNQPNQSPAEMVPNSMPMQVSFVGAPQPGSTGPEATYGYGSAGRPIQQQPPPQHLKPGYGSAIRGGLSPTGPRSALPPGNHLTWFDGEGGRTSSSPAASLPTKRLSSTAGDHIVGVIQRLEESGQTIDFNSVLDRLNGTPSGGSQRVWSS
ncbi:hypothetical protein Sango_2470500 [Sesamum angolense]|uniref:DUF1421 domain-containing protein n=1 Tax=Sesamum angolense TaxID=2727404 RepID=A0AAE2BHV9_9LAMI|nr:hypothetical protein Sango_2470500 [Sesamum angolense]